MSSRRILLPLSTFVVGGILGLGLGIDIGFETEKNAHGWQTAHDDMLNPYYYKTKKVEQTEKAQEILSDIAKWSK